MKITLTDVDAPLLPTRTDRSTGVHASDLYNGLYAELEPDRYGGKGGPNELKMAMGLAWEDYLEQRLMERGVGVLRPGEQFSEDGVAFTPDGVIGKNRGVEYKLTWMSDPGEAINQAKFAKYITQMQAYGYHLDINKWTLYALFVNGDYKGQRNPMLRAYDFTFTAKELKETWTMLRNYGRARKLL